jgi:hypothetical protein
MQSEYETMKTGKIILAVIAGILLQSCAKEDTLRTEGLTLGAGDAMARNTALQVIDPWPDGVEDTDLLIPNSRPNGKVEDGAEPAAPSAATNP